MDQSDGKRRQIIDAAVAEFRERGFAGASMDRVSARANVSKRTVYNHFCSKEALFQAIVDIMAERAGQELDIAYRPGVPIRKQMVDLGWAEGRLLTDPDFMKYARMVVGETMRDPDLSAAFAESMARLSVFEEVIAAAAADGALDVPDTARAATQFLGLIKAEAFWPVVFSGEVVGRVEMERIIQTSVEMFLGQYAPPGA